MSKNWTVNNTTVFNTTHQEKNYPYMEKTKNMVLIVCIQF